MYCHGRHCPWAVFLLDDMSQPSYVQLGCSVIFQCYIRIVCIGLNWLPDMAAFMYEEQRCHCRIAAEINRCVYVAL